MSKKFIEKIVGIRLPNRPLTNYDIERIVKKKLKIKHFRGVFMRTQFRNMKPRRIECGILNLDPVNGSHWTAYCKANHLVYYFDPIGNVYPPKELQSYLKNCKIVYNYKRFQRIDSVFCGHWSIAFIFQCMKLSFFKGKTAV